MNTLATRTLRTAILAAVAGFSLICILFYVGQEGMIFYPEALPADFKFTFDTPFEELHWPVEGAVISALHFKSSAPKGAILYFHGNAGSLRSWGGIAGDFTTRGYDVLIPDYRGYGKSTGRITAEEDLLGDAAVAYRYLQKSFAEKQIILYGRSIGTGIAVHLAMMHQPRMLILESPYMSLTNLAGYHYPFIPRLLLEKMLKYPLRSDQWIPQVSCPVYLIHGTRDDVVPYSSSEQLSRLIRTEHHLMPIPGGGHNNLSDFNPYHTYLDRILQ